MQCTRDDSMFNHDTFTTRLKLTNPKAHWCLRSAIDISLAVDKKYTGHLMKRHFEGRTIEAEADDLSEPI